MYIIVVLMLMLVGCVDYSGKWVSFGSHEHAVQSDFPRHVSACGFDEHTEQIIYGAVDWWNEIAGEEILVAAPEGCQDNSLLDMLFTASDYDRKDAISKVFPGLCDGSICPHAWGQMYPDYWKQPEFFQHTTARHEIGHYLGLGHDFPKGCVMHQGYPQAQPGLCNEELQEFCAHYPMLTNCK